MTVNPTRRTALKTLGLGLGGLALGSGLVAADPAIETLFTYDPTIGELPENVAVDRRGNTFVSFPPRGEIRRITPDDRTQSVFATFDVGTGLGVVGVEVEPRGTVFACLDSFDSPNSDTHGIWRVTHDGQRSLFAALDPGTFPNDILLDGHALLVTDSIGGAVLRVTEGAAATWVQSSLLEGTGALGVGVPIGANGIARARDGTVYVANAERGQIVSIPVDSDGGPGTPEVFVADATALFGADGLAIDTRDTLYVAVNQRNTIVRIDPSGAMETLASGADGLDNPTKATFGTSRAEQRSVYVTNSALFSGASPSLVRLDVGVPGRPVHP